MLRGTKEVDAGVYRLRGSSYAWNKMLELSV